VAAGQDVLAVPAGAGGSGARSPGQVDAALVRIELLGVGLSSLGTSGGAYRLW